MEYRNLGNSGLEVSLVGLGTNNFGGRTDEPATKAVIEICAISLADGVIKGMEIDQKRLETSLAMDAPTAEKAYAVVKADVEKTQPDCAEGSADRAGVEAVASIYQSSAPAAGAVGTEPPATPAVGTEAPATSAQ